MRCLAFVLAVTLHGRTPTGLFGVVYREESLEDMNTLVWTAAPTPHSQLPFPPPFPREDVNNTNHAPKGLRKHLNFHLEFARGRREISPFRVNLHRAGRARRVGTVTLITLITLITVCTELEGEQPSDRILITLITLIREHEHRGHIS